MNYRHAFHAGNHADVLKHLILIYCLAHMQRKEAPLAVLDTHAGAGTYDLRSAEAKRSPEWRDGIGRLWDWPDPPQAVRAYLDAIRRFNRGPEPWVYPGSPSLVSSMLRDQDVADVCELHPEDAGALSALFSRVDRVRVHQRDGWEALTALLPPPAPRGLVLIDPPYEAEGELERAARALGPALKRFSHGLYLWWRPLKSESALARVDAEAATQGARNTLRADLWVDTPQIEGKLVGSSMFVINPPFGLEAALREALPELAKKMALGASGWRVT